VHVANEDDGSNEKVTPRKAGADAGFLLDLVLMIDAAVFHISRYMISNCKMFCLTQQQSGTDYLLFFRNSAAII
jgi:hypothetical protein